MSLPQAQPDCEECDHASDESRLPAHLFITNEDNYWRKDDNTDNRHDKGEYPFIERG